MNNMADFTKEVSQLIENQFPEIYREEGGNLVAFVKAYYEFLESNEKYSYKLTRDMFEMRDIDTSLEEFLVSFKETYLADFPYKFKTDTKFAIKNIVNYYRSKGSKESLGLLMKMLFNEDVDVYYPGEDVLRLSDSSWYKPYYLEVTIAKRNNSFLNKEITGVKSGAKAFVESIVRKRIKGKVFDVMYLSGLRGNFQTGEKITDDGVIANTPRIKGSMTNLEVVLGGRNNKVGDLFNVVTDEGSFGVVKVTGVVGATGRVDFAIADGGWGYTTGSDTDVYVSTATLFIDNANTAYYPYERVYQKVEKVYATSATDIVSTANLVSSFLNGKTSGGTLVANGTIVSVANTYTDANNNVLVTANASSNAVFTILVSSGTFLDQRDIVLSSNSIGYQVGESITEESSPLLTVTNISGTFSVGEKIEQSVYQTFGMQVDNITATLDSANSTVTVSSTAGLIPGQPVSKTSGAGAFKTGTIIKKINSSTSITLDKTPLTSGAIVFSALTYDTLTSYAFGTLLTANSTALQLDKSWGNFVANTLVVGATSAASANPTDIALSNANTGALGTISAVNSAANTIVVAVKYGTFDATKQIRGNKTNLIYTINTTTASGALKVYLNGNTSANGIITNSTDNTVSGIVIGQNTTAIGIHGNTSPFFYSNTYSAYVNTDRSYSTMISPPLDSGNNIINVTSLINRIPGGHDADFEVGAISEVETGVTTYTDVVGEANLLGVSYSDVKLNGEGSGYGYVSDVTVVSGGTGYINGASVIFTGGGYAGGDPTKKATGTIVASGGIITGVTITSFGSGYFTAPTLSVATGAGANLQPVMNYGYGFPKNPNADYNNFIGDVLNTSILDVGRISVLSKINPGAEYTADPFVKVRNKYIASYKRPDLVVQVSNTANGSFSVGEDLIQTSGGSSFVKGQIKSVSITDGSGYIFLRRKSVSIAIDTSLPLRGASSGAYATYVNVYNDPTSQYIGDNAVITGTAISASGVATGVEVVSSGFGYINDGTVTLESVSANNSFVITAVTKTERQGIAEGYWRTTTSHLSSEKRIQDNKYYQEYSYDVLSGLSLDKYENILRNVFHVSGTRMFGSVIKSSKASVPITVKASNITVTRPVLTQLVTQSGLALVLSSGNNLVVRKETDI